MGMESFNAWPFVTGLHSCRDPTVPMWASEREQGDLCPILPSLGYSVFSHFFGTLGIRQHLNKRPPCLKRMLMTPPSPISPFSAKEAETVSAVTCPRSPDSLAAELGLIFWACLDLQLDVRHCTWCFHQLSLLEPALGVLCRSVSTARLLHGLSLSPDDGTKGDFLPVCPSWASLQMAPGN